MGHSTETIHLEYRNDQAGPAPALADAAAHGVGIHTKAWGSGVLSNDAMGPAETDQEMQALAGFTSSVYFVVLSFLGVFLCGAAAAAPSADLWPRWEKHSQESSSTIEHSSWRAFLEKYLRTPHPSGVNRVRYHAVTPADQRLLDDYIRGLERVSISQYNRDEQRAYWINLYNALTVRTVLEHFPVASIKEIQISPGFFDRLFGGGPWKAPLVRVEGEALALDDIEHRILRPIWRDPRVHYAVNCASIGCPDLLPDAFSAQNTSRLLDDGARAYVNHPRGVSFREGQLRLSKIYDWFAEDFGDGLPDVLQHLRKYARPDLRRSLENYTGGVEYHYDWRLNGDS